MVARYELTALQWEKIASLLPGKVTDRSCTALDNRLFVNGCLWVIRSGAMWHHLPERYGPWKRSYNRFRRWAHAGIWEQVFAVMLADSKNPYRMIDSSVVRAHQLSATGRGAKKHDCGAKSRRIEHEDPPADRWRGQAGTVQSVRRTGGGLFAGRLVA
jgi:putative transposase